MVWVFVYLQFSSLSEAQDQVWLPLCLLYELFVASILKTKRTLPTYARMISTYLISVMQRQQSLSLKWENLLCGWRRFLWEDGGVRQGFMFPSTILDLNLSWCPVLKERGNSDFMGMSGLKGFQNLPHVFLYQLCGLGIIIVRQSFPVSAPIVLWTK